MNFANDQSFAHPNILLFRIQEPLQVSNLLGMAGGQEQLLAATAFGFLLQHAGIGLIASCGARL